MGSVVDDLLRERAAFTRTIASLDEGSPAGCGEWSANELAVHLATGELLAAVPNAPFRWLVGHGVRLDWMAPANERALRQQLRRHDRAWALARLERPLPRLHRAGPVAVTSLLEFWAHHEDVLAANNQEPCGTQVDLRPVVDVLARYQRRFLDHFAARVTCAGRVVHEGRTPDVNVEGTLLDVSRWLSGRGGVDALSISGPAERVNALAVERLHI